jgi:RNA recognition motif-containing protein
MSKTENQQRQLLSKQYPDLISKYKLFIGGLSKVTTIKTLREYFSKFGPITDSVVMTKHNPLLGSNNQAESRGFGFVTFLEQSSAEAVLSRAHMLDGVQVITHLTGKIDCKRAVIKKESYSDVVNYDDSFVTNKIFVGGLPLSVDGAHLRRAFELYGKITDYMVIKDRLTGESRGFGFVEFEVSRGVI